MKRWRVFVDYRFKGAVEAKYPDDALRKALRMSCCFVFAGLVGRLVSPDIVLVEKGVHHLSVEGW